MSTKDIRTSADQLHLTCDVCGRTLLRGERSHPYLDGDTPRTVCELCTARAQHEGWLREGTTPRFDGRQESAHRRGPLLRRLRRALSSSNGEAVPQEEGEEEQPPPQPQPRRAVRERRWQTTGEPRHVRAIPSSLDQRLAAAVDAFNASEHPRTIAGITRSLGVPGVSIRPADGSPGTIRLLVAWELCWYRYEADLRDDPGTVRLIDQGAELDELEPGELEANALADEAGALTLDT